MDVNDLSVIVPCYNTAPFIQKLLDSLARQEIGDYRVEYIFVNNLSTDNTEHVLKLHQLPKTILQCSERGCGLARNVGIENSNGKFIWFMDSDDWLIGTDAIKSVLDKAYKLNSDMLRIPFVSTFPGHFSMVWQYLFKRSFIGELRFRQVQPAEDNEFTNECLLKLGMTWRDYMKLPSVNTPKYHYNYMREGSNMFRHAKGEDINQ